MTIAKMLPLATFRNFSGFNRSRLSKSNTANLVTNISIDDELWGLLEYYSEIEEQGFLLFEKRGIKNKAEKRRTFSIFQSFVRQAKSYYEAAKELHFRSSSLLYYYAFLNLVKAHLCLSYPQKISNRIIKHGLKNRILDNRHLKYQYVDLDTSGVFPLFYEHESGIKSPVKSLNVLNLLAYCIYITYQYESGGFGKRKMIPGVFSFVYDGSTKGWALIGIPSFDLASPYKKAFNDFYQYLERVEVPKRSVREVFDIKAREMQSYTFFQGKPEDYLGNGKFLPDPLIRDNVIKCLKDLLYPNYYDDNFDFYLSFPLNRKFQIPMYEHLAIYVVMFFLSGLVRYKPWFLEKMLGSKESWVIEGFVKSCPRSFLQAIISRIIGDDFVIKRR